MGGISHLETQLPECAGRTVHPIVVKMIPPISFTFLSATNLQPEIDREFQIARSGPTDTNRLRETAFPRGETGSMHGGAVVLPNPLRLHFRATRAWAETGESSWDRAGLDSGAVIPV